MNLPILIPSRRPFLVGALLFAGAFSVACGGSETVEVPAKPESLTADGTTEHVRLTWKAVPGATKYRVHRDGARLAEVTGTEFVDTTADAPGAPLAPPAVQASEGAHTDRVELQWETAFAANGKTHPYSVTALNDAGESGYSALAHGFRVGTEVEAYEVSFDDGETWTSVGDARTYSDPDAPAGTLTGGVAVASEGSHPDRVELVIADFGSQDGAERVYLVRGVNDVGAGVASAPVGGFRGVGEPTITWERSAADEAADFTTLADATAETAVDTNAPANGAGHWYRARVRAEGAADVYSNAVRGHRSAGVPTNLSASDATSPDHVALAWNAVAGASAYQILRNGLQIAEVTDTTYLDTGASRGDAPGAPVNVTASAGTSADLVRVEWTPVAGSPGVQHTYAVRAVNLAGPGAASNGATGRRGPSPVSHFELLLDDAVLAQTVGPVTEFVDTQAPVGALTAGVAQASEGTHVAHVELGVTGVGSAVGPNRSYRVRGVNASGVGDFSEPVTGFRAAITPTITWDRSATDDPSNFTALPNATGESHIDEGAPEDGEGRWYRARVSAPGAATVFSNAVRGFRGIGVPLNLTASDATSPDHVALSWDAVPGATNYLVYRDGTQIADVQTNDYLDTDAEAGSAPAAPSDVTASAGTFGDRVRIEWTPVAGSPGAAHSYAVRAVNVGGESEASATATGRRGPSPITSFEISFDGGDTFEDVGSVTAYDDHEALPGSLTAGIAVASEGLADHVELSITGIGGTDGPERSYLVRALNDVGEGDVADPVVGFRGIVGPTVSWERSESDSPSDYVEIDNASGEVFFDEDAPADGEGRWYRALISDPGAEEPVHSNETRGFRGAGVPVVTASDGTSADHVALSWDAVPGASNYLVFRDGTQIADVVTNEYIDTDAARGGVPAAPTDVTASFGTFFDRIRVEWTPVPGSPGVEHTYTVRAVNLAGTGDASSDATGRRGALPITAYEISFDEGVTFENVGLVTSFDDENAPAAVIVSPGIASASQGTHAEHVALTVSALTAEATLVSYLVRATNAEGTGPNSATVEGARGPGTFSYQWQRSAGETDADYSDIPDAITMDFDDTTAPRNGERRWYRVVEQGEGTNAVTSDAVEGWRGAEATVGGRLVGAGGPVDLLVNGESVTLASNGPFTHTTPIGFGEAWSVEVETPANHEKCVVENGAGAMGNDDVTDVVVRCARWYEFGASPEAVAVVGQPDFISGAPNGGGPPSASVLNSPYGAPAIAGSLMFVPDALNNRVLAYEFPLTQDGPQASFVLGQTDFTVATTSSARGRLALPMQVRWDGERLWVLEYGNNRISVYDELPLDGSAVPAFVVGKSGFDDGTEGCDQTSLAGPIGFAVHDDRLIVADSGNNRVLIWNTLPSSSGAAADVVLGQDTFDGCDNADSVSGSTMLRPTDVWTDGERLLVADGDTHRVLVWNTFPATNGQPADLVLGQPDLSTSHMGIGEALLNSPTHVESTGLQIFVSDSINHRILVWNAFPTVNGEPASAVLGQPDFITSVPNYSWLTSSQGFKSPRSLSARDGMLWVADSENHRIVAFESTY